MSLADTPSLRRRFGLPANQFPGVGYPQASILGLMDLATGLFLRLVVRSVFTHDLRGAIRVHAALQPGDILLADRAFAGFAHLALLAQRGIACVFRLSAASHKGAGDGTARWRRRRGKQRPRWIDPTTWCRLCQGKLPRSLNVRVISYRIEQPGYRTRRVPHPLQP